MGTLNEPAFVWSKTFPWIGRKPVADLREALAPVVVKRHAALTDPGRVGELLRAIEDYREHLVTRSGQLAALVFQRPGELRAAEWTDLT